jgi:pimeloyl-ACP methyl ester carboxylesterase
MLALLLRIILLTTLAFGCAWFWFFREEAWWQAWAGFWFPPLALASVMALEFALAAMVNRDDPAPRATVRDWGIAWCRELWTALKVFGWWMPFGHRAVPDCLPIAATGQTGVVFVHGFFCNRGIWTPWLKIMRKEGRAFSAINLEPVFGSIDHYAAQVDAAVSQVAAATGRPPVVVCHSMGGLAVRAWLRSAGTDADQRILRIITLGTPNNGTWLARFIRAANGRQMRHRGAWVQQLVAGEHPRRFTRFTCWYSNCDNVVFPASTATLAGADNRLATGLAHVELALDPEVMRCCLEAIRAS